MAVPIANTLYPGTGARSALSPNVELDVTRRG